jgi:hypothetical protein
LGLGIKRFAEFHDIDTVLSERGANRRAGVGLTGRNLQLDIGIYLLCHVS